MRLLCMHKAGPADEAGVPPSKELIQAMGQLIGEAAKNGILLGGDGLLPSEKRFRLTFRGSACDVTPGPYRGDDELPHRLVTLKVAQKEEAIEWARRFGFAAGASRLELGQLTEAWDLGVMPKPENAPVRFMIVERATADSEAGKAPAAKVQQAVRDVLAAMKQAGVLQFTETLLPSSTATRLNYRDHVRQRTDGPFTESKELIGGFCMMQMRSIDEMVPFADRYARILGGNLEIDIRVVADGAGGAP